MDAYKFGNYDDAIKMLQGLKKEGKKRKVVIFTIDFDDGDVSRIVASPDYGCVLIRKSKAIIINDDNYIPHMQLFSEAQYDVKNIVCRGKMHDIVWGHKIE